MDNKIKIKGTVVFANIAEPRTFLDGSEKYGLRLVISKSDTKTIEILQAEFKKVYEEGKNIFSRDKTYIPEMKAIFSPVKKGDDLSNSIYKDYIVLDMNSKNPPQIIDRNKTLLNPDILKNGSVIGVAISFYPYNRNGNCGITCKLHSIAFIRQGKPLIEESNAFEDFDDFDFDAE